MVPPCSFMFKGAKLLAASTSAVDGKGPMPIILFFSEVISNFYMCQLDVNNRGIVVTVN